MYMGIESQGGPRQGLIYSLYFIFLTMFGNYTLVSKHWFLGWHSTEVAFALLTLLPWVWFSRSQTFCEKFVHGNIWCCRDLSATLLSVSGLRLKSVDQTHPVMQASCTKKWLPFCQLSRYAWIKWQGKPTKKSWNRQWSWHIIVIIVIEDFHLYWCLRSLTASRTRFQEPQLRTECPSVYKSKYPGSLQHNSLRVIYRLWSRKLTNIL